MYGYKLLCGIIVSSNFGLADLEAFNVPGTLFVSFKPFLSIPVTPTAEGFLVIMPRRLMQHGPLWHDFQLRETTIDDFFLHLEASHLSHSSYHLPRCLTTNPF